MTAQEINDLLDENLPETFDIGAFLASLCDTCFRPAGKSSLDTRKNSFETPEGRLLATRLPRSTLPPGGPEIAM